MPLPQIHKAPWTSAVSSRALGRAYVPLAPSRWFGRPRCSALGPGAQSGGGVGRAHGPRSEMLGIGAASGITKGDPRCGCPGDLRTPAQRVRPGLCLPTGGEGERGVILGLPQDQVTHPPTHPPTHPHQRILAQKKTEIHQRGPKLEVYF